MVNKRYFVFALLGLAGCAGASVQLGRPDEVGDAPAARTETGTVERGAADVDAAVATITAADMYRRIAYLASDELAGRNTPSPGLERAAEYIAGEFERMGLRPAGDDGTYIQRYALQKRALVPEAVRLGWTGAGGAGLAFGKDYFVLPGVPERIQAEAVFAGPAAEARANEMLRGRVAVFELAGTPQEPAFRQALAAADRAAEESGAAAKLFVLGPEFPAEAIQRTAEHYSLAAGMQVGEVEGIPGYFVSAAAAERLFAAADVELSGLRKALSQSGAPVVIRGATADLAAPVRVEEDHRVPNVVAVLPGSDPELRDTYVVFSAHFDHVGVGRPNEAGDSIYNGADDNASGTAALLEVAEAFASLAEPPARSLVFLAVSGEEKGLLGSRYYSDHPTVPLEGIVANINVDMIGRNAPDSIVVIGQEYSSLGPLVNEVAASNPELGLTVSRDLWPEQRFFFRSDHFNFARKEIPALFFFAGVHEDYHRPSDHVEEIDTDKASRVARLIFLTAHEIATREEAPTWTEEGLAEIRAMTGGRR